MRLLLLLLWLPFYQQPEPTVECEYKNREGDKIVFTCREKKASRVDRYELAFPKEFYPGNWASPESRAHYYLFWAIGEDGKLHLYPQDSGYPTNCDPITWVGLYEKPSPNTCGYRIPPNEK